MSKKKKIWIAVSVLVLLIILAIIYIVQQGKGQAVDHLDEEAMDIMVQKASEQEIEETILVTGEIVPEDEQKIYPDMEKGEIKKFHVKENDKVKKGDTLLEYDSADLDREFDAAVRSRDLMNNNIETQQLEINKLAKEIEEMKKAMNKKKEEGDVVVSEEDVKELELQKNQQTIELENTKAELASAQSEIDAVDDQRKALKVKAKLGGTVVQLNKNLDKNEDGGNEPAVHIISGKPFKVVGTMSEFDAVKIEKGQAVNIIPKVYKDRSWEGEVATVSQHPTDDGASGDDMYDMGGQGGSVTNYPFTVNITDDTSELRQGFHVTMEVDVGGDEQKLAIPHSALMDDMMMDDMMMDDEDMDDIGMFDDGMAMEEEFDMMEDAAYIFVVNEDDMLERRDIETGEMSDEFIEITSGLELGELVVINPTPEMYDGMEVEAYDEVE